MKKYESIFKILFPTVLLAFSLWFFWFSLIVLLTPPDIFAPFIATNRLPHVLNLIFYPVAIFMSGNAIVSGGINSNRKLVNFTMGFFCFLYLLVAPTIEICKGVIEGKQLFIILSKNEEITAIFSLAFMTLAVLIIVLIGEKISKPNHD